MRKQSSFLLGSVFAALDVVSPAAGATEAAPQADGAVLGLIWVVPFAGMLLSIALLPLLATGLWHRHYGKIAALWAVAFALPFAALHGIEIAGYELLHTLLLDYLPFVILLATLFAVAGGIRLTGTIRGTPGVNTLLLAIGTGAASLMGTTGAAMLLLRPLIRANRRRRQRQHVFVFFIFLVANIGGALSPLGDPPLFLGFLKGVPFFWPTVNLLLPTVLMALLLLFVFYALDTLLHRHGWHEDPSPLEEVERLGIDGKANLPLLLVVPVIVFAGGVWQTELAITIHHVRLPLSAIVCNAALILVAWLSFRLTTPHNRAANHFSWDAMLEVAKLFAGIFVTIVPVIAMLRAGTRGAFAPLVALVDSNGVPNDAAYFWMTGLLSSFLDNAPTYLVFFNLAGGDPAQLAGSLARTLAAISAGAVFMGAFTYIGNAPNFMVKAICEQSHIRMPSFFAYLLWSLGFLLPLFSLTTVLFFL